jgi:hypothetical protein
MMLECLPVAGSTRAGARARPPGVCPKATIEEIAADAYPIRLSRYVGTAEFDDKSFEVKTPRLVAALEAQFPVTAA